MDQNNKSYSLFFLKISATLLVILTLMLLLRFVFKFANVAEGDSLLSAIIYNVTDLLVRPTAFIVSPLMFSSGAMVELNSFLLVVLFSSISGMFLWRLYLCSYEPLRVRSIHVYSN